MSVLENNLAQYLSPGRRETGSLSQVPLAKLSVAKPVGVSRRSNLGLLYVEQCFHDCAVECRLSAPAGHAHLMRATVSPRCRRWYLDGARVVSLGHGTCAHGERASVYWLNVPSFVALRVTFLRPRVARGALGTAWYLLSYSYSATMFREAAHHALLQSLVRSRGRCPAGHGYWSTVLSPCPASVAGAPGNNVLVATSGNATVCSARLRRCETPPPSADLLSKPLRPQGRRRRLCYRHAVSPWLAPRSVSNCALDAARGPHARTRALRACEDLQCLHAPGRRRGFAPALPGPVASN
jgi:hypothetical protein